MSQSGTLGIIVKKIPATAEVLLEINLAIFYFRGTYYSLAKRFLGLRYVRVASHGANLRLCIYTGVRFHPCQRIRDSGLRLILSLVFC